MKISTDMIFKDLLPVIRFTPEVSAHWPIEDIYAIDSTQ